MLPSSSIRRSWCELIPAISAGSLVTAEAVSAGMAAGPSMGCGTDDRLEAPPQPATAIPNATIEASLFISGSPVGGCHRESSDETKPELLTHAQTPSELELLQSPLEGVAEAGRFLDGSLALEL